MSGKWAREADTLILADWERLDRAALGLAYALTGDAVRRTFWLRNASAIIRRERKAWDTSAQRLPDFYSDYSDERLIWIALEQISQIGAYSMTPLSRAHRLREAEAALRTLYGRQRGDSR